MIKLWIFIDLIYMYIKNLVKRLKFDICGYSDLTPLGHGSSLPLHNIKFTSKIWNQNWFFF